VSGDPETPAEVSDHAYFQAIEEKFVELRGAPLLLSPVDWQVASRWHQEGVPLELVTRTLEELFARRKERGAKGRISSLRYCVPAVEAAWGDLRELTAPGRRAQAPAFEAAPRLAALASAVSADPALAARVAGLVGEPHVIEECLAELDREMLDRAGEGLSDELRAEIADAVGKTLASLAARLPVEELEKARERLSRQTLRRRLGLPVLSLFSPEAEPKAL
jgi:hypothetical protein